MGNIQKSVRSVGWLLEKKINPYPANVEKMNS